MDFVTGLPKTKSKDDAIWVIVDTLTKVAHFIAFRYGLTGEQMAMLYMVHQHRLHGIPTTIIFDRDPRFTARFWKSFHAALGTEVVFNTTHHPQTDGQSERTIQTLEDMLRACALTMQGDWTDHLHMAEFSYNSSYHASIGMSPFETMNGHRVRTPVCWGTTSEIRPTVPQLIEECADKVRIINDRLKAAQDRQRKYADPKRRDFSIEIGEHALL